MYKDLVAKWNPICKLVSRQDVRHLQSRHVDDSLGLITHLEAAKTVLDIGPGGGFPSIPLALALPNVSFELAERSSTKCRFLNHVKMRLNLINVKILEQDVRSISQGREIGFDVVTARAVAKPDALWEWSKELLNPQGKLILQTSEEFHEPLQQAIVEPSIAVRRGFVTLVSKAGS